MGRFWMFLMCLMVFSTGCQRGNVYTVEGTVIDIMDDGRVLVEHEEIEGFMDAMTMPFSVASPEVLHGVKAGDRIVGQLVVGEGKARLTSLRISRTTTMVNDTSVKEKGILPIRVGETFSSFAVPLTDGTTLQIGKGQSIPLAITFIYTTCPMPEFCPAIVERLRQLQPKLEGTDAKILAVTIDPDTDTVDVLKDYGTINKVNPAHWVFGRVDKDVLTPLITRAGMRMSRAEDEVVHSKRLLVLSRDGQLLERYDDANWPVERVAQQLIEGAPMAHSGASGTLTPPQKK